MVVFFNMVNNLGYVAVNLTNVSQQKLFDIISQKIPEKDYFQSFDPGYTYINGNVCQKAHLTICYGIKNPDLQERFKTAKLKIDWLKNTKIKDVQINWGYRGEYYIIVAIPDINESLFQFDSWIRKANDIFSDALPFNPHIALCYIINRNNRYPTKLLKYFQEKITGKTIEFESVNFYYKEIQIPLISFK